MAGVVSGGVTAACWSPDAELLAYATRTGRLALLTKDWDALADVSLTAAAAAGAAAVVSAAAGNAAAGARGLAPDAIAASISWRGDGAICFFFFSLPSPPTELRPQGKRHQVSLAH